MDSSVSKYTGKRSMAVDDDEDDVIITTTTTANNRRETNHHHHRHRRAHSDTDFRLDDLLLFDPSDLDLSSLDVLPPPPSSSSAAAATTPPLSADSPPFSDDSTSALSGGCGGGGGGGGGFPPKPSFGHHLRSLSVDSDFFDGLGLTGSGGGGGGDEKFADVKIGGGGGEKRGKHRHSLSMDGLINTTSFLDMEAASSAKKALGNDKLAELALIDPKRAKRILANRQSAARSKERKIRYTGELERKVQTLQSEATTLSAQVTMLQRDTTGLTTENKELKLRLQAMEQQAKLRDALNDTLKEEVQRLKLSSSHISSAATKGNPFNRVPPQFSSHPMALPHFGGQQPQQFQQQQQQQQQEVNNMPRSSTNNPTFKQTPNSFSSFRQRV